MRTRCRIRCLGDSRGQSLIEFSLCAFLLVMLLLGVVEIGRMILVYTTVANAAKAGVRYAEVHGINSAATNSDVQTVVRNYLSAAPLTATSATITPSGVGGAVGTMVTVTVVYPYDPLSTYFPLSVNLGSSSQGVITF
ncbi:MAG: TadE/TadG family type IV pilus assembly protein [Bryobacteraceae bacterium]